MTTITNIKRTPSGIYATANRGADSFPVILNTKLPRWDAINSGSFVGIAHDKWERLQKPKMTNHPNRGTGIVVYRFGSATEIWPNLAGVFRREFPIAVGHVRHSGQPQTVTYYGERYTICRAA